MAVTRWLRDAGDGVSTIGRGIVSAVYPERCAGCGRRGGWLCGRCDAALTRFGEPWCARCGVPEALDRCRCGTATGAVDAIRAVAAMDGWLRPAIHALKYGDEWARAEPLGEVLAGVLPSLGARDGLVPVPLHPSRLRHRGYNQSELLARGAGRIGGLPVLPLLAKVRATEAQVGLDAEERAANVVGAFATTRQRLDGARLLLVDDVVTTGATLAACASALRAAGAASVGAVVLAREL